MQDYTEIKDDEFESDGDFAATDDGGMPASTQEFINEQERVYQEEREVKALAWKERLKRRLKRISAKLDMVEKMRRKSAPKEWCHKEKPSFTEKVTAPKDTSKGVGR